MTASQRFEGPVIGHWVDGAERPSRSGRTAPVFNPATGVVQALTQLAVDLSGSQWGLYTDIEEGPPQPFVAAGWALLGLNAIVALGAASVAIGLARIDGRRDDAILGAVRAAPRLRRSFSFWQAAVLAGLGSVVGVILGTVPALALALPGGPLPFALPWQQLLHAAVAVPAMIAIGSWLTARGSRVRIGDRSAIG